MIKIVQSTPLKLLCTLAVIAFSSSLLAGHHKNSYKGYKNRCKKNYIFKNKKQMQDEEQKMLAHFLQAGASNINGRSIVINSLRTNKSMTKESNFLLSKNSCKEYPENCVFKKKVQQERFKPGLKNIHGLSIATRNLRTKESMKRRLNFPPSGMGSP